MKPSARSAGTQDEVAPFESGLTPGELHLKLIELLSPPSILVNKDFEIVHLSESAQRFLQTPSGEAERNLLNDVHPMLRDGLRTALDTALKTNSATTTSRVPFEISGAQSWVNIRVTPAATLAPHLLLVLFEECPANGAGVTEEPAKSSAEAQTADEKLSVLSEDLDVFANSERLRRVYETVLTNTPDLIYVFSLDHKFVYANAALLKLWGRSYEDAIGKTLLEIGYEPWHAEMHAREIDQVRATRQPIRGEVPFNGTQGRRIYEYIFVPVIGADGEVEAVAGTTRDVTERKETESKLQEGQEQLDFALAAADLGHWAINLADHTASRTLRHDQIFGYDTLVPEWTYEMFLEHVIPDDRAAVDAEFRRAVDTGAAWAVECRIRRSDGSVRRIWAKGLVRRELGGRVERMLGIVSDITDQRQAEERQAFLTKLADALRPLSDPIEVQAEASRLLGQLLGANRVAYFEIRGDDYVIERDYSVSVGSLVGRYPVASFGPDLLNDLLGGRMVVEADATTEPDRSPDQQAAFAAIQVRGHVDVPLVKGGRFLAGITVHVSDRREWTQQEVSLIEETAERTWAAVERVRAEEALRQSEERSDFVRRSSGIGFWYCDLPFDVLQWDELVKAHFHLPPDAVVTIQTFYDLIHPDDRDPTRLAIEESIRTRTPYNVDYRTVSPETGDVTWVRAIGRTSYAADGSPVRFDGVTLDVSDRKQAEEDLRKSQQQLEAVLLSIDDGLIVLDRDWQFTFISEQAARIFGVDQRDMLGELVWKLFPQDEGKKFSEQCHRALVGGKPSLFEEYYGEPIDKWLEWSCYPSPDGLTIYFRDVTDKQLREAERKVSERELAEERDKLRFMADSMPQMIFTATKEGSRNYFNRQWLEFTGMNSEQLEGLGWAGLAHPEDREALLQAWSGSIEAEQPFYCEYRLLSRDGTYRWHLSRAYPKRNELGEVTIWIGSSTDVDDARRSEELQRERLEREVGFRTEELMRSNEQLQGFTYSVAHDLRQQIRGINVNATILLREAVDSLDSDSKDILEALVSNAKRLSALVDDLLSYARLGRQEPKRVHLDLSQMAEEVVVYLRQSDRCPKRTEIKIAPGLVTEGDPAMIRLVLENLIDNACKHSADAENPTVEIGRKGDSFFVSDNGIGFDMKFIDKLFQPFERLHRDSEYPGTGIGLANVRRIVEKHGGRVTAEGVSGRGATFSFELGMKEGTKSVLL